MDARTMKEMVSRLKEVGAAIETLPPEIRAVSFEILRPYVTNVATASPKIKGLTASPSEADADAGDDRSAFFSGFNHDKPADNVKLVAAFHYKEFGSQQFKTEEVKLIADEVGITVPGRIDMTLRNAMEDGKRLFTSPSRGVFKPTVYGEAYFKNTYSVGKGTKAKPQPEIA